MNKQEIMETSTPHVVQISSEGETWFEYLDEREERVSKKFKSEVEAGIAMKSYCQLIGG